MTTFKWGDFLDLAVMFQADSSSNLHEAILRSAISRAYYAGYHHVEDWFVGEEKKGRKLPPLQTGISKHRANINRLRDYRQYGAATRLETARNIRNRCDYDNEISEDLKFLLQTTIDNMRKTIANLQ